MANAMLIVQGMVIRGEVADTARADVKDFLMEADGTPVDVVVLEQVTIEGAGGSHSIPMLAVAKSQLTAYGPIPDPVPSTVNPLETLKILRNVMSRYRPR